MSVKALVEIDMYEVKATVAGVGPKTYIVDGQAEAHKLALELLDRQYIVEVSEIESED